MINDSFLKLMSVSLVTSEGTLPLASSYQPLQYFYHHRHLFQQLQNQQASLTAATAAGMLVHNGRLPGGSPVPIPSPNSSLSHPESPRSQAGDSSISPPASTNNTPLMTVAMLVERDNNERFLATQNGKCIKEENEDENDSFYKETAMMEDDEENDEVLSIGGKDDEQMMMDCDSSVSENNGGGGGSVIKSEKEEGGGSFTNDATNKLNGHTGSSDEEHDSLHDDDEVSDKKNFSSPNQLIRCPSTTTTEEYDEDEEDSATLPTSEPETTNASNNNRSKKSQSHKISNFIKQDNHTRSQKSQSGNSANDKHISNLFHPFNITNLSRHSPTEDLYSRHPLHHHIVSGGVPHPNNYFLQQHHSHFFHQHHLINNHDTSSNHSTASSNNTNNSTSPSPSSTFNSAFLQHHNLHPHQQLQQQQQQTAAVAAAQSLIFSIANILRPDFGLCNNNNNNNSISNHHDNNGISNKIPQKSSHQRHQHLQHSIAALHGFGAKRNASSGSTSLAAGGSTSGLTGADVGDTVNHYNGNSSTTKQRSSGHRELNSAALHPHHRSSTTTPIDLSRPSSTGSASATMQMISPTAMMSMMLERGGPTLQSKSRHQPHHQSQKSQQHYKFDKHSSHQIGEKNNSNKKLPQQSLEKPEKVVNPSSANPDANPKPIQNGSSNNTKSPTANNSSKDNNSTAGDGGNQTLWPAWVYCTRYSDRPSSGPRTRRVRKKEKEVDEKRPRTAFTAEQLSRLKKEFEENRYLTEKRRQDLARELKLHENQIKIWFQNKRAKLKKASGSRGGLAMQLMAQGLYNHSTVPPRDGEDCSEEDDDD